MVTQAAKYHFKSCLAAVLLGLLLPLSMAPFNWWPLGVISMAGLAVLLCRKQTSFKRFILALWFGIGLYGLGASWIYVAILDHGQAGVALSLLLISSFVCVLALLLSIPFLVLGRVLDASTSSAYLFMFPCLWVLGEWLRGWAFTGFPWLYLGYGHTDTWLVGWAPVIGTLGISWIVAFCGGSLALVYAQVRRVLVGSVEKSRLLVPTVSLIFGLMFWLGGNSLQTIRWTKPAGEVLSIGLVQPAIPVDVKWDPYKLPEIFDQMRSDTALLLNNDLVVWPESAIPRLQHEVADYLSSISEEARDSGTALITGIPSAEGRGDDQSDRHSLYADYYNSVVGLGLATGQYHKQHLVPFGEYVPLENWLRGLIAFFDLPMSSFSRGPTGQAPIKAKGVVIATAICYEIAYSELVRIPAQKANLLLTLSNDTWFGESIGPIQHFQIARMRAIENGKPLIRSTNDGISALVNADGKVIKTMPAYKPGVLEGVLEIYTGVTPFGRYGSFPILLMSLLVVVLSLVVKFLRPGFA